MKILSLFSGAGGFDLGLIQAGNQVVWANDIDKNAASTYMKNIGGHIICADIKDISMLDMPSSVDAVVGGFPCQGFSQANMRRAVDDDRNMLYKFFLYAVRAVLPKYFIAENVKGILSLDGGNVINLIKADFMNAGYVTSINLIHLADFGIPQTRQRVFIIGHRKDIPSMFKFLLPQKTHCKSGNPKPWMSMKSAIGHYPEPDETDSYLNHVCSSYKLAYRDFTAHRPTSPDKPSPTILARGNGKGGVCAIPHYNGKRRISVRESATLQTFPENFEFIGPINSCYRQVGNAVPVKFAYLLGTELIRLEGGLNENSITV